jgi:hypothetical protein
VAQAAPATSVTPVAPPAPAAPAAEAEPLNGDEAAPWPSPAEEAAFLGGAPELPPLPPPRAPASAPTLPPVEEMVQRLPAALREQLDDLFRARYTAVRRIPPEALKK